MIGETQPEMELLEEGAFIYPFLLKINSSIPGMGPAGWREGAVAPKNFC